MSLTTSFIDRTSCTGSNEYSLEHFVNKYAPSSIDDNCGELNFDEDAENIEMNAFEVPKNILTEINNTNGGIAFDIDIGKPIKDVMMCIHETNHGIAFEVDLELNKPKQMTCINETSGGKAYLVDLGLPSKRQVMFMTNETSGGKAYVVDLGYTSKNVLSLIKRTSQGISFNVNLEKPMRAVMECIKRTSGGIAFDVDIGKSVPKVLYKINETKGGLAFNVDMGFPEMELIKETKGGLAYDVHFRKMYKHNPYISTTTANSCLNDSDIKKIADLVVNGNMCDIHSEEEEEKPKFSPHEYKMITDSLFGTMLLTKQDGKIIESHDLNFQATQHKQMRSEITNLIEQQYFSDIEIKNLKKENVEMNTRLLDTYDNVLLIIGQNEKLIRQNEDLLTKHFYNEERRYNRFQRKIKHHAPKLSDMGTSTNSPPKFTPHSPRSPPMSHHFRSDRLRSFPPSPLSPSPLPPSQLPIQDLHFPSLPNHALPTPIESMSSSLHSIPPPPLLHRSLFQSSSPYSPSPSSPFYPSPTSSPTSSSALSSNDQLSYS